jgi:protein-arginine kinase activator protein McsA
MENTKLLFEKYISYHTCPRCGGNETYHSHAMENLDMKKYGNVISITLGHNHANKDDVTMTKSDLCLTCGHIWVMYVARWDAEGNSLKLGTKEIK